ncbi:MAG: hypothetical protein BGO49_24820 [Planctomycetales bacterium 71-10]|nr:MAG: hypothetical protein BGO49_24820 [Planctomycetales bacterium 71-10]
MKTKTAKTAPIVYRQSFTQKLAFPVKPDAATRRNLVANGWKYNGLHWWKNSSETQILKPSEAEIFYAPDPAEEPEAVTA